MVAANPAFAPGAAGLPPDAAVASRAQAEAGPWSPIRSSACPGVLAHRARRGGAGRRWFLGERGGQCHEEDGRSERCSPHSGCPDRPRPGSCAGAAHAEPVSRRRRAPARCGAGRAADPGRDPHGRSSSARSSVLIEDPVGTGCWPGRGHGHHPGAGRGTDHRPQARPGGSAAREVGMSAARLRERWTALTDAGGATGLALALLVLGCVFVAVGGPAESLEGFRTRALQSSLATRLASSSPSWRTAITPLSPSLPRPGHGQARWPARAASYAPI